MRRISLVIAVLLVMAVAAAQYNGNRPKFSPEKFQAELERFIAKEACLSPKESARFFPVYSEMKKKKGRFMAEYAVWAGRNLQAMSTARR